MTATGTAETTEAGTIGGVGVLWALLGQARRLHATWEVSRLEADRLAMVDAWDIHITCTGARSTTKSVGPRGWQRCTPTVLVRHTGDEDNHMAFRGACLGCGWVAEAIHGMWEGGENAAAEDANDHTHPGWRNLPVVERPPRPDSAAAARRADPHPTSGCRHPACPRGLPRWRLRHVRRGYRRPS